jgi:hypothetical protein
MQWPFNREWYSHLKRGLRRPQVSHQKGMLRFEGITMAETPANAPFRGVGARMGDAVVRGNKAFSWRSRAFPALAACVAFSIIPFTSLARFPAPLPAVFIRPLLASSSRVACHMSSTPAAARDENAGKEKWRNRKNMKLAKSSTTTKRPAGVPIRRAAQSDRSRAERPRSLHAATGCWGLSRSVLYDPLGLCLLQLPRRGLRSTPCCTLCPASTGLPHRALTTGYNKSLTSMCAVVGCRYGKPGTSSIRLQARREYVEHHVAPIV